MQAPIRYFLPPHGAVIPFWSFAQDPTRSFLQIADRFLPLFVV